MARLTQVLSFRIGLGLGIIVLMWIPGFGQSEPLKVEEGICAGLHCEMSGSGDPIIAIHGLGASNYSWKKLHGRIPNHQLILIDLRGAGKSPKPHDKHYSTPEQAELIYQYIREKNLKNLTLMGNSYGGAVALLVTLRLKETPADRYRLSKLILIDSGGYKEGLPIHLKILRTPIIGWLALHVFLTPNGAAKKVLKSAYYEDCEITDEQVKAYGDPIGADGGRYALLQTAKQAIPKDIEQYTWKYPTITVPTLILWGDDDRVIKPPIACRLHKDITTSTLVVIKYAGHVPQEERPDATICQINLFLGSNIPCPPQVPPQTNPAKPCKLRKPPKDPFKQCPLDKDRN